MAQPLEHAMYTRIRHTLVKAIRYNAVQSEQILETFVGART